MKSSALLAEAALCAFDEYDRCLEVLQTYFVAPVVRFEV